jgi:hypothetical protein
MNYIDTFIMIADDCPTSKGIVPTVKEGKPKPIHTIQYELISENPYKYTQEDILFFVYAERNSISKTDKKSREDFFKKGQPCLRSSALTKKYGWGVHFDNLGKAALYSADSNEYKKFVENKANVTKLIKAMRNKKAKA